MDALIAAAVPSTPVRRFDEVLQDPWLWENGHMAAWEHPRLGPAVSARTYGDFSRTPGGFTLPTPDLGQHSAEVLAEYGINAERIADMLASGAAFHTPGA